jgi:hypothetical protein
MPHTGRVFRSEGSVIGECLRIFVAESNASDRFWLEMVFRTSRLPYSLEVVTQAEEASRCIGERHSEMDLIFDAFGVDQTHHSGYFVLVDVLSEDAPGHHVEKPFTRQKLTDCLYAAELHAWAERLAGRTATAA